MSDKTTTHEIRIDLQGLIKLLAHNLYAEPDVFVREMLQNAHDSIQRRHQKEGNAAPAGLIRVLVNPDRGTITFLDNGQGLCEEEIHDYLSTIGRSGTDAFRQELQQLGRGAAPSLIGQFGIGLLSAFVVADEVVLTTRSAESGSPAWRWASKGGKTYGLTRAQRDEPGTEVVLFVRSDRYRDMLRRDRIQEAIRKYADFLPYPILLDADTAPANAVHPPWSRTYPNETARREEYKAFVARRYPDNPLHVIPVQVSEPVRIEGILYISDWHIPDLNSTGLLDIYQHRMLVAKDHRDLLPRWARFVRGIVDIPGLTLTAARDNVQQDENFKAAREALGREIVEDLTRLRQADKEGLVRILRWHQYHVTMMAAADDTFFEAAADLIPVETNQGPMPLADYLEKSPRTAGGKPRIVYFTDRGSATQYYMLFNAKNLLVVDACFNFTEEFLRKYEEKKEVELRPVSVASSQLLFPELPSREQTTFRPLVELFLHHLHGAKVSVTVSRFEPRDLPAVLILGQNARLKEQLEATRDNPLLPDGIRKLLDQIAREDTLAPAMTLFLNGDNETIQRLAAVRADENVAALAAGALYHNALILAQHFISPENAKIIFRRSCDVVDRLLVLAEDLGRTRAELVSVRIAAEAEADDTDRTPWVSCFVALPSNGREDLFLALQTMLEDPEVGWQVLRAEMSYAPPAVPVNVLRDIRRAHCYLAGVSELDPSVSLELGLMLARPERPLITLRRQGGARRDGGSATAASETPAGEEGVRNIGVGAAAPAVGAPETFDGASVPDLVYPVEGNQETLKAHLRKELLRSPSIAGLLPGNRPGRPRYLPPAVVRESGVSEAVVRQLTARPGSAEDMVAADVVELAAATGVREVLIRVVQDHVARAYGLRLPPGTGGA